MVVSRWWGLGALAVLALGGCGPEQTRDAVTLLNVSYDPTREFYRDLNAAFERNWLESQGQRVRVLMSHGGSGKQARAVIDGLPADVVTLALAADVDSIANRSGLVIADWRARLPHAAVPFYSSIVFLVRSGNPRRVRDWADLLQPGLQVVMPHPQTSGGARWNYLAAWGAARLDAAGSDVAARVYVQRLLRQVPLFDPSARAATTTFVQRGLGDVLLTWESEAWMAVAAFPEQGLEVVRPGCSIRAEPVVAVVDRLVDHRGSRALAEAYLRFHYSPTGQRLAVRHYFRLFDERAVAAADRDRPGALRTFGLAQQFGSWAQANTTHFAPGGTFDQLTRPASGATW
ncbi:MAG: sulfate ABC transporter substrate-binding protein [Fimbriimonadaceae bacterium]|nr:sulfate ABC transporter substrate-binding protein [Fimbriimonadaceae bacterium]